MEVGRPDSQASFEGMNFRDATELSQVRVGEKTLEKEMGSCAKSGREFYSENCDYSAGMQKTPDLFPAGTYSIRMTPVSGQGRGIGPFLLVVTPSASSGVDD
jgi:hypothetical protein